LKVTYTDEALADILDALTYIDRPDLSSDASTNHTLDLKIASS